MDDLSGYPTELQSAILTFFFFQAEDGIRAGTVTGVQTCALPICTRRGPGPPCAALLARLTLPGSRKPMRRWLLSRSEERRVGKEGRSRWTPYRGKNER